MYDIIIVGAGPAGMTAALYALRASKKVLIFEAKTYGGQIVNANLVENCPGIPEISGFDYANNLYNQVKDLGAEFKFETVVRVTEDKKVITNESEYTAKSIILATGAENRKLNIERESEFVGKGVSYCATCDGNFYKNKNVAVVGGGNTALADAIYLSNIASKVYLIHRRDQFRGEDRFVDRLNKKENVEFVLNSNVSRLNGEDKLTSIEVKNNNGDITGIDVDCLFIAVGQTPKNEIFANVVELNEHGYAVVGEDLHTKVEGIYIAGDARVKSLRQLTTATSDGSVAATTAIREMKKDGSN